MKKNPMDPFPKGNAPLSPLKEPLEIKGTRENPYSISEINREVKLDLESDYSALWITGEISNFNAHRSGHYYFSLKDEFSQISAVMFFQSNQKLKFVPEDGLDVLAFGKLSLYLPRGTYQIIVEEMEPRGIGSLQFAYEQLKRKLAAEGLFDEKRKKAIPHLPRKIGIITSPTGAAIQDLIRILSEINIEILIFPSLVQGEEAAGEIIRGLKVLNDMEGLDLLILCRGGGSMEDLWPFNEESVARAIAASQIPIMTAIGHETDFTIADFVSDRRCPTPSAAAAFIVQKRLELQTSLHKLIQSLSREGRIFIAEKRERVLRLVRRRGFLGLEALIREKMQMTDDVTRRLATGMKTMLQDSETQWRLASHHLSFPRMLSHLKASHDSLTAFKARLSLSIKQSMKNSSSALSKISDLLHSLSPLSILKRGYSICQTSVAKRIVRRSSEVTEGEMVDVTLYKGSLLCEIKERHHDKEKK